MDKILEGRADEAVKSRAKNAKFDECLSFLGLLLDGVGEYLRSAMNHESTLTELVKSLKNARVLLAGPHADAEEILKKESERLRTEIENGKKASSLSADAERAKRGARKLLDEMAAHLAKESPANGNAAFELLKKDYDAHAAAFKKQVDDTGKKLSNVFAFCEEVFGNDSQQILILVSELTISSHAALFISHYGCKEYFAHNKELLFYVRQKEIITEIENLDLDD